MFTRITGKVVCFEGFFHETLTMGVVVVQSTQNSVCHHDRCSRLMELYCYKVPRFRHPTSEDRNPLNSTVPALQLHFVGKMKSPAEYVLFMLYLIDNQHPRKHPASSVTYCLNNTKRENSLIHLHQPFRKYTQKKKEL
jgi:hypothetical protein